ncbi:unnamed protein product, partial [Ceratitis capitata]
MSRSNQIKYLEDLFSSKVTNLIVGDKLFASGNNRIVTSDEQRMKGVNSRMASANRLMT